MLLCLRDRADLLYADQILVRLVGHTDDLRSLELDRTIVATNAFNGLAYFLGRHVTLKRNLDFGAAAKVGSPLGAWLEEGDHRSGEEDDRHHEEVPPVLHEVVKLAWFDDVHDALSRDSRPWLFASGQPSRTRGVCKQRQ